MEQVATTTTAGWVRGKFHDFSTDEILPPQAVDRLEEDAALLSRAIVELHRLHHYPLIDTSSHTMGATASADTVTLEDNVTFAVGGVVFDTHDLDTRVLPIPDNATRFLRAEVDAACGDLVDYGDPANGVQVDPLVRKLVCNLILTEGAETDAEGTGGGPSSPTSMRILKAIKGAAGTLPVITLYRNDGLDPATSVETHEAADPAHAASKISYDNSTAGLAGAPTRVQAAIDALATLIAAGLASHAAADPAHTASAIGFDNTAAGLVGHPGRTQAAIEAIVDMLRPIDSNISLYVRPDGDDNNDGLSDDADHAFLTLQHAIYYISHNYNLGPYTATVYVADGTYTESVMLPRYAAAGGHIAIIGASVNGVVVRPPAGATYGFNGLALSGAYNISLLTIDCANMSGSYATYADIGCQMTLTNVLMTLGGGASCAVSAVGRIQLSNCTIIATLGNFALYASRAGSIILAGDVAISGTYSITANCSTNGQILRDGAALPTVSGTVTGTRYSVSTNGIISVVGGGASYFPGTVAGSTESGGQYV